LSFGSQLDGMVVCDGAGAALRPALIWMDRRAEAQAAELAGRMAPDQFYRRVGANLDSSHAVFKALWVRDEEPQLFARVKHVMPPGSYVLWKTSGVLAVDYSNASSLALLDPRTRTWSDEVLDATGIDRAMLPSSARERRRSER
jgi:xylulokinase